MSSFSDLKPSLAFKRTVRKEDLAPITIFLDTETRDTEGDGFQRLLCGCYEVWPTTARGTAVATRHGRCQPVLTGHFTNEADCYKVLRQFSPCRVIAHNWQFDAGVLRVGTLATMKAYGYKLDMDRSILPIDNGGFSPFFLRIVWQDGQTMELIDNTNFHKTSLSNLAPSFGLEKLEMPDMDNDSMEKILTYCARDVEVLRESWFYIHDFSNREAKITHGITVATMAQRMYAKRWFPNMPGWKMVGNRHLDISESEMLAYSGGRSEVFYKGCPDNVEVLRKYDANSMYPSCMRGCIPIQYMERGTVADCMGAVHKHHHGDNASEIWLAKVTVTVPPDGIGWLGWEGVKLDGLGLCFPCGAVTAWVWQPALWTAVAAGWQVEVHECHCYRAAPVFLDYVTEVYALRAEAKRAGDKPRALLLKYLLNSLYGKFAQGNYGGWSEVLTGAELDWCMAHVRMFPNVNRWSDWLLGKEDGEWCNYMYMGGQVWKWLEADPGVGRKSVCSVAGYITSRARACLLEVMRSLVKAGSHVYMCDTDSVITDGQLDESLIANTGLGYWDLEEECAGHEADFQAPKHYSFGGVNKCKGIRKPVRGVFEYKQAMFSKYTTDLLSYNDARRQRLEKGVMVKDVVKTVTGCNRKRTAVEHGFNEPIKLVNGVPETC